MGIWELMIKPKVLCILVKEIQNYLATTWMNWKLDQLSSNSCYTDITNTNITF